MKALLLAIAVCAALAIAGCGSDDSGDASGSADATTATDNADSRAAAEEDAANEETEALADEGLVKPDVEPGPVPKKPVVEDIEEGSGPETRKGDKVTVHFVADDKTGEEVYSSWPGDNPGEPLVFKLGSGRYYEAFEKGVEGMKLGGRRELGIPGKLAFTRSPLFYVVDLIAVE